MLLIGHLAEWQELLLVLRERRGLTVIVGDPISGTSALLAAALVEATPRGIHVDARRCADALDLAIAIADASIAALAPDASAWWLGSAPPSNSAGLRLSRMLGSRGIDPQPLRSGEGEALARLREAVELTSAVTDEPITLAIDHLGYMLANMRGTAGRATLDVLRATRQHVHSLDLILVDHPQGAISRALGDPRHPLYHAGERLHIPRPTPDQVVSDLAITQPLTAIPEDFVRRTAELADGVPSLTWQAIAMSPASGEAPSRALSGWEALRRACATSVRREWELLRRVHPAAQTLVAAISTGLKPHGITAASKTVADGLNRLRDVGIAWQPAQRTWAISDPLLAAYAREHAQPSTRMLRARHRQRREQR